MDGGGGLLVSQGCVFQSQGGVALLLNFAPDLRAKHHTRCVRGLSKWLIKKLVFFVKLKFMLIVVRRYRDHLCTALVLMPVSIGVVDRAPVILRSCQEVLTINCLDIVIFQD